MGKHATSGNSLTGHKNTTLKQGAKHYANARVYNAALLAGPVVTETFEPLPMLVMDVPKVFQGINPVFGQDFTQTGTNTYKLRVKEGFIGLRRVTIKPKDGKSYGVWVASYAGTQYPLLTNRGQALDFKGAKDKLFQILVATVPVKAPRTIIPAEKRVTAPKAYTGGDITTFVIYATGPKGKIKVRVPEGKTSGEVIDSLKEKDYSIDRIANS